MILSTNGLNYQPNTFNYPTNATSSVFFDAGSIANTCRLIQLIYSQRWHGYAVVTVMLRVIDELFFESTND